MLKRPIIDDVNARIKAINDQVNGIVDVMALTRPKTPDERNLELLEKYNRKQLPLPRTIGTDLDSTNDQLEKYLNDPIYARNNTIDLQKPRPPARLYEPSYLELSPQTAQPEPGEVPAPESTNLIGQTVGRFIGPAAKQVGIGTGAVGRSISEFSQDRIPVPEDAIGKLSRTKEEVFSDMLVTMNTDEAGWAELIEREGQDAADLLFADHWLREMGSNTIIPGNNDAERAAYANYRIGRLLAPKFDNPDITVAQHMLTEGHNPAALMQIPLSVLEAAEGPITISSRIVGSQVGRQIDIMNGGDGSKGEMWGDIVFSFAGSFPKNPVAGARLGGTVYRSADDVSAGLRAAGRPVQKGSGIAGATGADFLASEIRDVAGLATPLIKGVGRAAQAAGQAGEQAAEAIGRTGVGNALDPVPSRVSAARTAGDGKSLDELSEEVNKLAFEVKDAEKAARSWGLGEKAPKGVTREQRRALEQRNADEVDRLEKNVKDAVARRDAANDRFNEAKDLARANFEGAGAARAATEPVTPKKLSDAEHQALIDDIATVSDEINSLKASGVDAGELVSKREALHKQLFADIEEIKATDPDAAAAATEVTEAAIRAADDVAETAPASASASAATHFPDDATVNITTSQRNDLAAHLKSAADDLLSAPNVRLPRNKDSFDEFVRELLDEHGNVTIPKKITGYQLGQYRKLAQEILDNGENLSKQKIRSLQGFIKKIDDQTVSPQAANEALIRERGLDVKGLAGERATRIERPSQATAARTTREGDVTENLLKQLEIEDQAVTQAEIAARESAYQAAKEAERAKVADTARLAAEKAQRDKDAILPRPIRSVASTVGRVTKLESIKLFNLAKFILKTPVRPRTQAKEFFTFIKNEKVILSGDEDMDALFEMLKHAEDRSDIQIKLLKKTRQRVAKELDDANEEVRTADGIEEHEAAINRLNAARKTRTDAKPMLGIPEHLEIPKTDTNYWSLSKRISNSNLSPFDKARAHFSYIDLLHGHMITKSEIDTLTEVFGAGFRQSMNRFRGKKDVFADIMRNLIGSPITFQGSYDMSAPFRQGFFLFTRMPANGVRTMRHMILAFANPAHAIEVESLILSHPRYLKYKDAGFYHAKAGDVAGPGNLDEIYVSSLPSQIPFLGVGIRASQRAYNTFLNKMRFDYIDKMYDEWSLPVNVNGKMVKPTIPKSQLEQLATLGNYATGRGPQFRAPGIDRNFLNQVTSVVFYAPRLAISRFALPIKGLQTAVLPRRLGGGASGIPSSRISLAKKVQAGVEGAAEKMSDSEAAGILRANSQIRKEAATLLARSFGSMLVVVGGIAWGSNQEWAKNKDGSKRVEVELDPRSTDFGKTKIGPVRVDGLAGMQQVFRVMAQLLTNQGKTSGSGSIVDKEFGEIIGRFLRAKFSPSAGLLFDTTFAGGETFIGEETFGKTVDVLDDEGKPTGEQKFDRDIGNLLWERLGPLFLQDLVEAMKEAGMQGALLAAPGFFGTGTTTYQTSREIVNARLKEDIEATDDEGNRIIEMRELNTAQRKVIMRDVKINESIKDLRHRGREDQLLAMSEARDTATLARDERLIRGIDYNGKSWRRDRTTASIVGANVSAVRQAIEGGEFEQDQNIGGAIGIVIELMGGKNNPNRNPEEQALFDWYELMDQHIVDPVKLQSLDLDVRNVSDKELEILSASIDLDNLEVSRDRFLAGLSKKQMDYVLQNTSPNRTGVENTFLTGQRMMEKYWDIPESITRNVRTLDLYDQYRSMPAAGKKRFLLLNPSVKMLDKRVRQKQERVRKTNKHIDEFIVTFYDGVPQHPSLRIESRAGFAPDRIRQRVLSGVDARLDESLNLSGIQR
jgi:hypothetical protein